MGEQTIFAIGDQVQISNLTQPIDGVVRAVWTDHLGTQFQVQYLDGHGAIQRDYFAATELRGNATSSGDVLK